MKILKKYFDEKEWKQISKDETMALLEKHFRFAHLAFQN